MKNLHLTYFKLLMRKKLNLFLSDLAKILKFQKIFYRILSVWTKVAPLFDKLVTRQNYSSLEEIFTRIGVNKTHLLCCG